MNSRPSFSVQCCDQSPRGFSLLEVLVASGILVVGLAAVAALMPAAANRLDEAVKIDRAVTLADDVYADLMMRRDHGLFAADNPPSRLIVFGKSDLVSQTLPEVQKLLPEADDYEGLASLFPVTTWWGPDALEVGQATSGLPQNLFTGTDRRVRQEMCWLATLSKDAASAAAGTYAVFSIVVFRKPDLSPEVIGLELPVGSEVYNTTEAANITDEKRRAYLRSCSYVLDPGRLPPASPWLRVRSSWTQGLSGNPNSSDTRLIFDASPSGSSVIAFENIVRVDSRLITLE